MSVVSAGRVGAVVGDATRPALSVIGVDPSLTGSGIASSAGWCELVGAKNITKMPLADRVAAVEGLVAKILVLVGDPHLVVIEVPAFSRTGGGALERAALWWLLVRSLWSHEIPTAEVYNQTRMKYATGKGAAGKDAIVEAVTRRWPAYSTGGNNNLCDAVVLMAMGADQLDIPLAPMPATHRIALNKVDWPEVWR